MKRREFIHQMAHAAAFPALFSSMGLSPFSFSPFSIMGNTLQEGNILIILLLNGGNDGLNTVIPLNMMANLNAVRPHVVLPESKVLDLGVNDLGLHPSLPFLKSLHSESRLKIIHSVGYPQSSYSHFRAMDIYQSASDASEYVNSGWLGRYLEDQHPEFPQAYPNANYPHPLSVEIGWNTSLQFTGQKSFTSITASNPDYFYEIINEFDNEYPSSYMGEKLKYLQLMAKQSNLYGEVLKSTYNSGSLSGIEFPRTNLGDQFKILAKLISGGLNTRIYKVEIGGFDTHGKQVESDDHTKGEHANLLTEINDAIQAFMQAMDAQQKSDRILGMTLTEFGRTVHSNGTFGTDHGTVSPMFFWGNNVDTSIEGKNPYIPSNGQGQYDLERQFDFRQIYQGIINQWLGGSTQTSDNVLFKNFDELQIIKKEVADLDGDGVPDIYDQCPETALGAIVDLNGCPIFQLAADNYSIKTTGYSCIDAHNGKLEITVADTSHTYQLSIAELGTTYTLELANNHSLTLENLSKGTYTLVFTLEGQASYAQEFSVKITEPPSLSTYSSLDMNAKQVHLKLSGSERYLVTLNGAQKEFRSDKITLDLKVGYNQLTVKTPLDCQGEYHEELFVSEKIHFYPNPVESTLNIQLPGADQKAKVIIYNTSGIEFLNQSFEIPVSRNIAINSSSFPKGIYIVNIDGNTLRKSFKVIKK